MPKIVIENLHKKEIFNENEEKTLLHIIHENNIDWMHACGAKGRCTTCKAIVTKGMDAFSPLSSVEEKYRHEGKLSANERLACQCYLHGDASIRVDDKHKFMHVTYSD